MKNEKIKKIEKLYINHFNSELPDNLRHKLDLKTDQFLKKIQAEKSAIKFNRPKKEIYFTLKNFQFLKNSIAIISLILVIILAANFSDSGSNSLYARNLSLHQYIFSSIYHLNYVQNGHCNIEIKDQQGSQKVYRTILDSHNFLTIDHILNSTTLIDTDLISLDRSLGFDQKLIKSISDLLLPFRISYLLENYQWKIDTPNNLPGSFKSNPTFTLLQKGILLRMTMGSDTLLPEQIEFNQIDNLKSESVTNRIVTIKYTWAVKTPESMLFKNLKEI